MILEYSDCHTRGNIASMKSQYVYWFMCSKEQQLLYYALVYMSHRISFDFDWITLIKKPGTGNKVGKTRILWTSGRDDGEDKCFAHLLPQQHQNYN